MVCFDVGMLWSWKQKFAQGENVSKWYYWGNLWPQEKIYDAPHDPDRRLKSEGWRCLRRFGG